MPRGLIFFLGLVSLLSCGKSDPAQTQPTPPPLSPSSTQTKASLLLFGAPWCSTCKSEFKKIKEKLDRAPSDLVANLSVQLYVTTGGQSPDHPTQEIADKYLAWFQLRGRAIPDPWRWQTFRRLVSEVLDLPGAAVLDDRGNLVKSFEAGPTTFVADEIVDLALDRAK